MTGLRGPVSKPDHLRQRRNKPVSPLVIVSNAGADVEIPPAPAALRAEECAAWEVFWRSEEATIVRETQLPTVRRLFENYSLRSAIREEIGDEVMVFGATGHKANPLLAALRGVEETIRKDEDRLGLSPRSYVALGLGYAKAKRTIDDLNDDVADDEDDPRMGAA